MAGVLQDWTGRKPYGNGGYKKRSPPSVLYAPTRSSKSPPRAPPPDPRLKPGPVFVASGGIISATGLLGRPVLQYTTPHRCASQRDRHLRTSFVVNWRCIARRVVDRGRTAMLGASVARASSPARTHAMVKMHSRV